MSSISVLKEKNTSEKNVFEVRTEQKAKEGFLLSTNKNAAERNEVDDFNKIEKKKLQ